LPSSNLHVSPIAYKDNNPIVSIKVKGVTEVELDAYVDSGAGISLIPRSVARKLGLEYVGETPIITGKGKSVLELYRAVIGFHGRDFKLIVAGQDLPKQSPIKALLGRDIMDNFRVCFDGRREELEFMQSKNDDGLKS